MKMNHKEKLEFIDFLEEDNPKLFQALINNWRISKSGTRRRI